MKHLIIALVLLWTLSSATSTATTIHVPTDIPTIQAGIHAATAGDTVLVEPGTYYENIALLGADITLASRFLYTHSSTDIENTIIDGTHLTQGDSLGSVVRVFRGESRATIVTGFTIRGGIGIFWQTQNPYFGRRGGGIAIENSSPRILSNIVRDNTISANYCEGAGIYVKKGTAEIRGNTIVQNRIDSINYGYGAGVFVTSTDSAEVVNNLISENIGDGLNFLDASGRIDSNTITRNTENGVTLNNPTKRLLQVRYNNISHNGHNGLYANFIRVALSNNVIARNFRGIACSACGLEMTQNTVEGNSATGPGGGLYKYWSNFFPLNLRDNIFWHNSATQGGPEVYIDTSSVITMNANDVEYGQDSIFLGPSASVNWSDTNITADPFFCYADTGDYQLMVTSLCAPMHSPTHRQIGAFGVGCALEWVCGDMNGDGLVDPLDLSHLINYYFDYGPGPIHAASADINCDGSVDIGDVVMLAAYLNGGQVTFCCHGGMILRPQSTQ